jgi:hypothetical protein
MQKMLSLIPLLLALGSGQQLLVNGDFEQDLSNGWVMFGEGSGTHYADRATDYQPDPDYEAYTYQYDNPGSMRLGQTVDAPGIQLELSFWASFAEAGGSSTCWPAACFSVCYRDAADALLGETRYYYSTYANWTSTSTLSLIRVTDPNWRQYTLSIADELSEHLPGVNPGDVARIEVALYSYTYSG